MLIGLTAVFFRVYQLGSLPPGLYRDEALNGVDAVRVLNGDYALFFPANNGREPLYIYLTAVAIGLLGQTAVAVRLAAAVVGSATTWVVYKLGNVWFGREVGLLTAWLWAVTLWPVHLSRVGLRVLLLVPLLAATFWLATLAYRRQSRWLWLGAGVVYGVGFYTYLAIRFTPLLLGVVLLYLLWRHGWRRLWPGGGWFVLATAVLLLPLAWLGWQEPELVLGRTGQVSVLNPAINGGDLWGTLWRQGGRGLGMFVWRGDSILRHNALQSYSAGNGRSLFDIFMVLPFVLGVLHCLRQWRRPVAAVTLLWVAVMLGPTVLAEDTPHFLRAVGVLPAALMLPALGLHQIWGWRSPVGGGIVVLLLAGSMAVTVRDYLEYGQQPDVAYLFEAAARDLAEAAVAQPATTAVYLDEQFRNGWPSVPFLLGERPVRWFGAGSVPQRVGGETAVYAWPYASLDYVAQLAQPPALVTTEVGSLSRGDLEPTPYPLYFGYRVTAAAAALPVASFADQMQLLAATAVVREGQVLVTLTWATETAVLPTLTAFVHLVDDAGLVGQVDGPPGGAAWRSDWWQPGVAVAETRVVVEERPFASAQHWLRVGLYDSQTGARVPVSAPEGAADFWVEIPLEAEVVR